MPMKSALSSTLVVMLGAVALTAAAGGTSAVPAHPASTVNAGQGGTEIEWPGVPA